MTTLWMPSGEPIRLGAPLTGRTGEGVVYDVVGRPDLVAKVFHPELSGLAAKLDKVAAMVQSPPTGAVQPDGFAVLTWPLQLLMDQRAPVGYAMRRIDTATSVELHTMSNPTDRANPRPTEPQWTRNATWGHLVNVAANLCLAVDVVHRVEAVIGDFQERNILVSDTTRVTLIDCDSMQFIDRSGRQFLCPVGRPEFTAPELVRLNLREHARQKPSDLFALAVHIHQLLLAGNHPFLRGEWTGTGEQPDATALAIGGDWAGGPKSRLRTHRLAPPVTFLPPDVQLLFVRAFTTGAGDPESRPTAGEWRTALTRMALTTCPDGVHQVPVGCVECPWCRIDDERANRPRQLPSGPIPRVPGAVSAKADDSEPETFFGLAPRTYLIGLAAVVVVVVALAAFIVWALVSGSATLG